MKQTKRMLSSTGVTAMLAMASLAATRGGSAPVAVPAVVRPSATMLDPFTLKLVPVSDDSDLLLAGGPTTRPAGDLVIVPTTQPSNQQVVELTVAPADEAFGPTGATAAEMTASRP